MQGDISSLRLCLCLWLATELQTNGLGLRDFFASAHLPVATTKVKWINLKERGTIRDIQDCISLIHSSFNNCFLVRPLLPTHCICRGILFHSFELDERHIPVGTPVDEGSVRRRDLYLTTNNIHKGHTSMYPAGFEPTIPADERLLGSTTFDNSTLKIQPMHCFRALEYVLFLARRHRN